MKHARQYGDSLFVVTTRLEPSRPARRGVRSLVLTSAPVLALLAAPAYADVPEGWDDQTEVNNLDALHALGIYVGAPLLLFVLIVLAIYVPAMARGEKLLPDHAGPGGHSVPEGQWIGGPRQGVAELPAPDGDDSRAGGASGRW